MAGFALQAVAVPTLLAGAFLVVLAGALQFLRPTGRAQRAFALLLCLRGILLLVVALTPRGSNFASLPVRLLPYFYIALPLAALAFLWTYRARLRGAPAGTDWVPWSIMALALPLEVLYMLNHDLFLAGPRLFFAFFPLETLAYVAVAFALGRAAGQAQLPHARRSASIVALGFLLEAMYFSSFQALVTPMPGAGAAIGFWIEYVLWWTTWAFAMVVLAHHLTRPRNKALWGSGQAFTAALAIVTGVLAGAVNRWDILTDPYVIRVTIDAAWTLVFVLLVAYALLRYRFFDLDIRARWTVRQGTLAAFFLAFLFAVTEGAAAAFQGWSGSAFLGIGAASVLVFFLAPIQQLADKVSKKVMPDARPVEELGPNERLAIYRDLVQAAWHDGTLSVNERRVLLAGRSRLGLNAESAERAEAEALAALPTGTGLGQEPTSFGAQEHPQKPKTGYT